MATINYKDKYEKAVQAAMLAKQDTESAVTIRILEEIFPELKESEDEKLRKWCISHFRGCFRITKDNAEFKEYINNKVIPWLEKQGEQKPAWSEEDKDVLEDIEEAIINYWHWQSQEDLLDWLKSLRPQSHWKPSDEQMVALKHAFNDGSIDFADMKILGTLYEQLKALHRYEQDT